MTRSTASSRRRSPTTGRSRSSTTRRARTRSICWTTARSRARSSARCWASCDPGWRGDRGIIRTAVAQPSFEPSPLAPRPSAEDQARDRDLGFGAVVSRESHQRLLNRDGSFNVTRTGLGFLDSFSPYHLMLTTTWRGFFAAVSVIYLALNLIFALAYLACGRDALAGGGAALMGGRFSQAFFFSIQTFATIGYGQVAPNGMPANIVVTVEALVGLMYQALATGLLFARFTRPTAALLFSREAVIAPYRNGRALMLRLANQRRSEIIELSAQVLFSALEPDGRGGVVRRYTLLPLERN